MKPDELLDDLGRLARTQAAQTASGDAVGELLRPFDAAAHDRIVTRLLPLIQPERQVVEAIGRPRSSQAVHRRPRPWRWIMAVAPALAGAVVLIWFVWPQAEAPLPMYALELRGGLSAERGAAADAILRVGPGDRVSAVLRPAIAVSGTVAVGIFVDGQALPDTPARVVEQSADGAVRVSGLGPGLAALTPGRHRLQFVVGRPGNLPKAVTDALPPSRVAAHGVQLISHEIERLPR
jgi:hypothetical protein